MTERSELVQRRRDNLEVARWAGIATMMTGIVAGIATGANEVASLHIDGVKYLAAGVPIGLAAATTADVLASQPMREQAAVRLLAGNR